MKVLEKLGEKAVLKVVYVLVSDEQDFFYEQLLISITSLRNRMKAVEVVLLTEKGTMNTLRGFRGKINNLINQIIVEELPNKYNKKAKSRVLKTMMGNLIDEDFLYIDGDTVICEDLSEIMKIETCGAVLDNHMMANENLYEFQQVRQRAEKVNFSVGYEAKHINTGVLWCKNSQQRREFFLLWNRLWKEGYKKNIFVDQLSFNEANNRLKGVFRTLDGKWNCQLRYGIPYLSDANIIHYFSSNRNDAKVKNFAYILSSKKVYQEIRDKEGITKQIQQQIMNPKGAFEKALLVEVYSDNYWVINSNFGAALRYLFQKWNGVFWGINRIIQIFRRH